MTRIDASRHDASRPDADWAADYEARARRLEAEGMYRAADEHASCGVGLVAAIDDKPSGYAFAGERPRLTGAETIAMFEGGGS
jgi:hypothetical protein